MKKVHLFEQFVIEANSSKKIKDLENDLVELRDRMEEVQTAMDNGDMDADEAELQLSDLDAQEVEMENELAELTAASIKDEYDQLSRLINRWLKFIGGRQSAKWDYMKDYCTADDESMMHGLLKRDKEIEDSEDADADKLEAKMLKISKDFSAETKEWLSHYFNEFRTAQNGFSAAGQTLQGAKESCEDHKLGCKNVKVKRTEYDKAEAALNKAKAKENELKQIILK
jgi:hypothetical protein